MRKRIRAVIPFRSSCRTLSAIGRNKKENHSKRAGKDIAVATKEQRQSHAPKGPAICARLPKRERRGDGYDDPRARRTSPIAEILPASRSSLKR
jgi:hypothetical protein